MYDPPVQRYKTVVMQRIQQAASRGYIYFTQGEVRSLRCQAFAEKMFLKYEVGANQNRRNYRRRLKQANCFLFLYPKKNSDVFLWWLLATEGEGAVHDEENLSTIFNKQGRLQWDGDYELVVVPKEGASHTTTWRMTRRCYQEWHDRIRKSIRQKYTDDQARQSAWSLSRAPGFSGIRTQVKRLHGIFRSEWRRTRRETDKMPALSSIGYVRGLKSDVVPLSVVVKRMLSNKRPFPNKVKDRDFSSTTGLTHVCQPSGEVQKC